MARRRYTDEERATAVVALEAEGYPDKTGALTAVSRRMGVPGTTLRRWFKSEQNPPPAEMVHEKKIDLVAAIKAELAEVVAAFSSTRPDADYRALMTAFGILTDKLQLLEGKATQRTEVHVTSPTDELRSRIAGLAARQRTGDGDSQPLRH